MARRGKIQGIGPRRAEIIVAGAAVFRRALELFQRPSLHYSAAGVRDGIIADLAARGAGRELTMLNRDQRRVVEQMAGATDVQMSHARKVAELAHRLVRVPTAAASAVARLYGKLLEAAGYLHDIGHYVSDTSHHKHSYYLVANSDLPGFTDRERQMIALLCRYHRKSMPLPGIPHSRNSIRTRGAPSPCWSPLLRIADSLDRSHEQRVDDLQVQLRNGSVNPGTGIANGYGSGNVGSGASGGRVPRDLSDVASVDTGEIVKAAHGEFTTMRSSR